MRPTAQALVLDPPTLDDLLQSPVMKALVWAVSALEDAKGCEVPDDRLSGTWYANFSRERT